MNKRGDERGRHQKTIREEILYENAKLISRSAYGSLRHKSITDRYKKLQYGVISISDTVREWERQQEMLRKCVSCAATDGLATDDRTDRNHYTLPPGRS